MAYSDGCVIRLRHNTRKSTQKIILFLKENSSNKPKSSERMFRHLIITLVIITATANCNYLQLMRSESLKTVYRWKQMDFVYLSEQQRQKDLENGKLIRDNIMPLAVERWGNRLFINTPHWKKGVPVTLSTVPTTAYTESPPLTPYPSYDVHNSGNCTGIVSVFRMNVDPCGTLWLLDSGAMDLLSIGRKVCPPAIVAINLNTDEIVGRYTIPSNLFHQDSLTTNIVVDTRGESCNNIHVYISDSPRNGLIVFRVSDAAFWRFNHFTFIGEPLLSNYSIHNVPFQWTDGLLGMSLGRYVHGDRSLYYHALSSSLEFEVSTKVIQDPSRINDSANEFKLLGSRGYRGQVSISAIDRRGVMFYNLVSRDSIGCWDTRKPYTQAYLNIVEKNSETLIFPNDIRADHETPQYLWIISNRLPLYLAGIIDPREYNYRILSLDPVRATDYNNC